MTSVFSPALKRFEAQTHRTKTCHFWTGETTDKGAPVFDFFGNQILATRFLWEAHHGLIPDGMHPRHKCGNRDRVNLDHLFLDTRRDLQMEARTRKLATPQSQRRRKAA